ncbi:MAG TPA: hypothetical protein VK990_02900 [Acidimicrobiia bacterium]|nr:hypothetical protein [Acidimicrobiia bacterium]
MTAVLIIEGIAIILLAVLVVGLLRSNADVLRALHELGAGEPGSGSGGRLRRHQHQAPAREGAPPDVAGSSLSGSVVHLGLSGAPHSTLLAFLSTGCSACIGLWDGLRTGVGRIGAEDTRLVVVTKGPEAESESRLRELAPEGVTLVQSTDAWTDYQVPVSPYFVLVDGPSGAVIGEGSATSWGQVSSLMSQAVADANSIRRDRLDNGEFRADAELRKAGIRPGDPSLYPEGPPRGGDG